jgi:hypothetical protein
MKKQFTSISEGNGFRTPYASHLTGSIILHSPLKGFQTKTKPRKKHVLPGFWFLGFSKESKKYRIAGA